MAITRATNLAAVGSGLGTSPAQPIDISTGIQMDGSSTGIITANTFSGTATNAGTAANIGVGATGYSLVLSGDLTAANVTVGGTLTYDDVTNIDSIGLITARNGLQVLSGVSTFSGKTRILDDVEFHVGTNGGSGDYKFYRDSGNSYNVVYEDISGAEARFIGNLSGSGNDSNFSFLKDATSLAKFTQNGIKLYANNSEKLTTNAAGVSITGMATVSAGMAFTGFLREGINIVSGKLSDNTTINIDHSMVHYFTTAESTTGIPNFTSTAGINTDLSVGETFSVNVITTAAAAGYSTGARIDAGATLPVLWNGGTDPSAGGSAGVDAYTYQVIKTGDEAFTILGNVSNFA